jgi:hypothetical protein
MAAAALVAVTGSIVRGRTLVRAGPLRVTAMSFAASSVLQAGEWLLLQSHPRFAACVIYLHVVGFGAIVLSDFWSVMNELCVTGKVCVGDALVDAMSENVRIRAEQVVTYEFHFRSQLVGEQLPAFPVVFAHAIFK